QPSSSMDAALEDWPAAAREWDLERAQQPSAPLSPGEQGYRAEILARVGRMAEAEALTARLPPDCAPCWSARGLIAALKGDAAGSERAFAEALRLDPTEPGILVYRG